MPPHDKINYNHDFYLQVTEKGIVGTNYTRFKHIKTQPDKKSRCSSNYVSKAIKCLYLLFETIQPF